MASFNANSEIKNNIDDLKNFGEDDIKSLINKLNLDYDQIEREEIIKELGLNSNNLIEVDSLILKSKKNRRKSKFSNFYENIINLFTPPSEIIINILIEAKTKMLEYKENSLSEKIEWVIRKIKNEEIYNLHVNIDYNDKNEKFGLEFENTMKLISEYSTDNFNRNKREDIVTARKIGKSRLSVFSEKMLRINSHPINNYNSHQESKFKLKEENPSEINFQSVKDFDYFNSHPTNKGNPIDNELIIPIDHNIVLKIEDDISQVNNIEVEEQTIPIIQIKENCILDDINFNIFDYINNVGREMVLKNISLHIFENYNLFLIVNRSRFESFLNKIRVGYDFLLPYHNEIHAADVLNSSHIIAMLSNIQVEMDLTILDLSGFFIAAIIHDYKHPGLNNNYHINKRTELSLRYNDISVLENYHVSSAFKVISQNNSNIFCDIQNEEFRVVRKRIVECVLATDMAKHVKEVAQLKIKLENYINSKNNNDSYLVNLIRGTTEESKFDRQQEVLNFFIHCADISNPAKLPEICHMWTDLVLKEFFAQGDLEKKSNLPISFLCDRSTTNIPKSQIGFINNIVTPCFNLLQQIAPKLKFFMENLKRNSEYWASELEKQNK